MNERLTHIALLPWMVAGVRTQYENLRLLQPLDNVVVDTLPIIPYQEDGLIERLPFLRSSQKGTLRSMTQTLPLVSRPRYDAIWTQALLPLLPYVAATEARHRAIPSIVYAIDTTPTLMDGFYEVYYGKPHARGLKRGLRDLLHRYLLRRCAAVAPWSHWAARSFIRDYGVPEERVHVILPGVDLIQWSPPPHRQPNAGARNERTFRLLFVGADWERKGGPLLLDVFRQHLASRCELHLVTKAAVEEGPSIRVYRGFGPNEPGLRQLYEECDALVLPTRADCFSLASIEAMACGLPVITCPVGGIPEIVRHGETGFLISPDDGSTLLSAIEALLDDPALCSRLGLTGRAVAERKFDNSRNSARLLSLVLRLSEMVMVNPDTKIKI